ncbi:MAG: ABC-three component system protein [Sphaerochaetaceae bacterium]
MEFKDFFQVLHSYLRDGRSESDYFIDLIGMIVTDGVENPEISNPVYELEQDTIERICRGQNPLNKDRAKDIISKLNTEPFKESFGILSDESHELMTRAIERLGVTCEDDYLETTCTIILTDFMDAFSQGKKEIDSGLVSYRTSNAMLLRKMKPVELYKDEKGIIHVGGDEIPLISALSDSEVRPEEMRFFSAVLEAIAEATKRSLVTQEELQTLPSRYSHFVDLQKKNFLNASFLQRGLRDTNRFIDGEEQFNILEDEIFDGVIEKYYLEFPNGYTRLIAVLEKATNTELCKSALMKIKNLVGNSEKKGICHIFVNQGRIHSWVDIDD